ncbi:B12-binding domain-containing radical SAM protein [bacterium]|nr:B12-binding domain-containing radical SAM protein [bacterium]
MQLLLINPNNPAVSMAKVKQNPWNRYRVWKPLGLLVLAGQTPPEWAVTVLDENLGLPDYASMSPPDLVGITAFTSQATRAYEIAAEWRARGVPVVMGGIHATMRQEEALARTDAIVTGEAEGVWPRVLEDARRGALKPHYEGDRVSADSIPIARHDLLPKGYYFGSIQTARGCPLNCSFCSVTAFSGRELRRRPIDSIIEEFRRIRERHVFVVDDNLIGTRKDQIANTKELFRAMIAAKLGKKWIAQVTINMADDEELLELAAEAGCAGVFIGFETTTADGLAEVHKKFNIQKGRDFRASVGRIQRHGMPVMGSFIMGLDVDKPGVGRHIAQTAHQYGVDFINVLFLTPLPGTGLWEQMESDDRIVANDFPEDWQYYTLTVPVGRYKHLTAPGSLQEMDTCNRTFYSLRRIVARCVRSTFQRREPLVTLVGNFASRRNSRLNGQVYTRFGRTHGDIGRPVVVSPTGEDRHVLTRAVG